MSVKTAPHQYYAKTKKVERLAVWHPDAANRAVAVRIGTRYATRLLINYPSRCQVFGITLGNGY